MRIAFAMVNCNRRDGSARPVNEVSERLARRGHEVHLFARKAEDLDLGLVRWHRMPGPAWPEVADFWTYRHLVDFRLRDHRFDIVHSIGCNTLRANVVTIQNVQPAKRRILRKYGSAEKVSLPRRLTRLLYLDVTSRAEKLLYTARPGRRSPYFLPVSRGIEAELRQEYAIGAAKVRIVPNAADTEIFRPLPPDRRREWRERHGFRPDDVVAVFSGGEWSRKGLGLAIEAVAKVADPRCKLFVAGDDPDRPRFQEMAAGAAGRVTFGGFRQDIATVLGAGDLFLFPSYYEAFSLATIEAAACGLPVVAARINGTEDLIRPGVNGCFIEHDPGQIAAVLTPLIGDAGLRRRLGAEARATATRDYTWDRVAAMTEECYREVVEDKR